MLIRAAALLATLSLIGGVSTSPGGNATLLGQPVTGSPIRHVIVMVQENRTFDNLFASSVLKNGSPYPGADTSQTARVDGETVHLQPISFEYPADPSHSHPSLLHEWNDGRMDGFATDRSYSVLRWIKPKPAFEYAYLPDSETAIYHLLAARYALADENFAPRLVPRFRVTTRLRPHKAGSPAIPTTRFGVATPSPGRRFPSSEPAKRCARTASFRVSINRRSANCSMPRT